MKKQIANMICVTIASHMQHFRQERRNTYLSKKSLMQSELQLRETKLKIIKSCQQQHYIWTHIFDIGYKILKNK